MTCNMANRIDSKVSENIVCHRVFLIVSYLHALLHSASTMICIGGDLVLDLGGQANHGFWGKG